MWKNPFSPRLCPRMLKYQFKILKPFRGKSMAVTERSISLKACKFHQGWALFHFHIKTWNYERLWISVFRKKDPCTISPFYVFQWRFTLDWISLHTFHNIILVNFFPRQLISCLERIEVFKIRYWQCSVKQRCAMAMEIYYTFLSEDAHLWVNLCDRNARQVKKGLIDSNGSCVLNVGECLFDTAQQEIYELLNLDGFRRFMLRHSLALTTATMKSIDFWIHCVLWASNSNWLKVFFVVRILIHQA